jgi:dTDP-glucose 4,6-dehydratase
MRLFVTGGAGFIGANFAHIAVARGHDVVMYDALTYAGNPKNIEGIGQFVKGDICDSQAVAKIFQTQKFDAVINFAAESHVDRSIADGSPFVNTNVVGAVTLLEQARKYEVSTFVQISTDEVYGSIEGIRKFTLNSPLAPSSPYSASKAAADLLLMSYHHTHAVDVRITRCTNNYGRFQHPEKFIPTVLRSALAGEKIPVYGDGKQVRDWIFVDDHCEGILKVLEGGAAGAVYHFGGPALEGNASGITNIELVHLLLRLLSEQTIRPLAEFEALIAHVTDRPGHDRRYALDWSQTENDLHWQPHTSLEHGLRKTVEWWLAHQDWWQ